MDLETQVLHAFRRADASHGAIVDPIVLSTTFERESDGAYPRGFSYTRSGNPNRAALENTLAAIEGAAEGFAFASGSAATMSLLQTLQPGDHVIAPTESYFGTRLIIDGIFSRWGLTASFVDMTSLDAVKASLTPRTRLVWVESPSNPRLAITDLAAVARLAHAQGALCVVDNTIATPVLQKPLALGCDFVMHSTTKSIGGHSDVLGGVLLAKAPSETSQRLRDIQKCGGAVPSPFDCWLSLRGLRTLPLRVRAASASAQRVAAFLAEHAGVTACHYPGLAQHPGHELATKQMQGGFGSLLSFEVPGGRDAAFGVASRLRLITRATSLGGIESLIEHRASVERGTATPEGLLRVSIGLESVDDLIADLQQALG